jgi:hypothetical protein
MQNVTHAVWRLQRMIHIPVSTYHAQGLCVQGVLTHAACVRNPNTRWIWALSFQLSRQGRVFFYGITTPIEPGSSHYRGFTIALRHTTLAGLLWTSDQIDAESFLPDSTQHPQETDMHTVGFALKILASERLQTNPLDRAALRRVSPMYTLTPSICPHLEGPRAPSCPRHTASCWCS